MLQFTLSQTLSLAVVMLIALPIHELAHALTADYFGDDTPRLHGRITLNPFAHLDLVGSLMLLLAGFGWAKPVPVNEYALLRNSRYAPAFVALAGPLSNLVLGLLSGFVLSTGLLTVPDVPGKYFPSGFELLYFFAIINFVLFFFNLIPLFPLDGEKIAVWLLPTEAGVKLSRLRRFSYGPMIIVIWLLPFLGIPVLNWLVFSPSVWLVNLFIQ